MITVVGSLNLDLVIRAPRLPAPGETISGSDFRRVAGGKGANQACAVARMGQPVSLIGAVGADAFGDELLASLLKSGVDVSAVARRVGCPSGTALIVVAEDGQNQIVLAAGANETVSPELVAGQAELIRRSQAVLVQLETPLPGILAACELAHAAGVPVFLNPAPSRPLPDRLLALTRYLIPNELEAAHLAGQPVVDLASAARAGRELRRRTPSAEVLITLGANGVWVEANTFNGHQPGFVVEAIDTVAAGDTFIGALASQVVAGGGLSEATRFACAAAALAVTRPGAQESIPTRAEVETWLKTK